MLISFLCTSLPSLSHSSIGQVQSAVFREQKDYNLSLTSVFVEDKQKIRNVDWSTKAFFSSIVVQVLNVEEWWRHLHLPYRIKLWALAPNADSFKLIILKFKTFIYYSSCKVIKKFCVCGSNTCPPLDTKPFLGRKNY